MQSDNKHFLKSLIIPSAFVIVMWAVKLIEYNWNMSFATLGIFPLKPEGLLGIITAPFIHENFEHLISNSIPFFLMTLALFYFYKGIAGQIFLLIYLVEGLCVWLSGREAYHIGASGILYGLFAFIFFSGVIRRDSRLAAISILVVFLYGGMVWGAFPDFFPGQHISHESHLWGILSGLTFALFYRKEGPARLMYSWELEKEIPEEEDEKKTKGDVYWAAPKDFDEFLLKF